MATPKRKRTSTTTSKPNKRLKAAEPQDDSEAPSNSKPEHVSDDESGWWSVKDILDEGRYKRKLYYLVVWEDIDPKTGEVYPPSWQPTDAVTEAARNAWRDSSAHKGQSRRRILKNLTYEPQRYVEGPSGEQRKQSPPPQHGRTARVIESSAEPSTAPSTVPSTAEQAASAPARKATPTPTPLPSTIAASADAPGLPDFLSPRVQIGLRGSSLDRAEFDPFSQLPASQPTQSQSRDTDLDSSPVDAGSQPCSLNIVHDTQSSAGEASFVPATPETNQQSTGTSTSDSQQDNGLTQDSGLLDIIHEAASRETSPASSIPETVADTIIDSQIQPRAEEEDTGECVGAESAFEVVVSSSQAEQEPPGEDGVDVGFAVEQQVVALSESQAEEDNSVISSTGGVPELAQAGSSRDTVGSTSNQVEDERALQIANTAGDDGQLGLDSHRGNTPARLNRDDIISTNDAVGAALVCEAAPAPPTSPLEQRAGLTEKSAKPGPENAQRPFPSEHPDSSETTPHRQTPVRQSPEKYTEDSVQHIASADNLGSGPAVAETAEPTVPEHLPTASALPESEGRGAQVVESLEPGAASLVQIQEQGLPDLDLEPQHTCESPCPPTRDLYINEQVVFIAQSIEVSKIAAEESVQQLDFVPSTPVVLSSALFTESREQNAQIVISETHLSTQEDNTESIRPTVEGEDVINPVSPRSRHDSSQTTPEDTPDGPLKSAAHSISPIAPPPSYSLGTFESQIPPRPTTPVVVSSILSMADRDSGKEVLQAMEESNARRAALNPFIHTRPPLRSSFTARPSTQSPTPAPPPAPEQAPEVPPAPHVSARRLLRTNASPEGTRSPSTVPDRSPAPQVPTSLRTVAFAHASNAQAAPSYDSDMVDSAGAQSELNTLPNLMTEDAAQPADLPVVIEPEDEELSDADDDDDESNDSLLNDNLDLAREEYIVPLFIEGMQKVWYEQHIQHKKDALDRFLKDPRGYDPLSEVEDFLSYLRAIETHTDLVYAEAVLTSRAETSSSTQAGFSAQFGVEHCTKFRFLHSLFHYLRQHKKHIVLVTEKDHDPLFDILATFCKAKLVNYSMPTKGRRAELVNVEGTLLVTIIPRDSSPIIQPPDIIICLDGVQDATHIRQKNWAKSSHQDLVPVIHLVTPRTVGHIERYIPSTLDIRERLHTILAILAQMQADLGRAIDEDTPRAVRSAELVGEWLINHPDDEGLSWPLPSIGSVKEIIEFQTQMSPMSDTPPPPERTKRPLDDEELDPAKRMRFTPQPQTVSSSSMTNNENEITHISDSLPGTAPGHSDLQKRLEQAEEDLQQERVGRKADAKYLYDLESVWDARQTEYENLTQEHRLSLGEMKMLRERVETLSKNNETLRERLATSTTEKRDLAEQLTKQRETDLLSDDAKISEITLLRSKLAAAQEAVQKAQKTAQSAEATLEYTKEQYRNAQEVAASEQAANAQLHAEISRLQVPASGEPARLKAIHISRQTENIQKQNHSLKAELTHLKRLLAQVQDEFARWKNNNAGRMGVGTRAQSVTPQPKTRSRAASPMGGRLSNLRNS